jgi:hypothetical protein
MKQVAAQRRLIVRGRSRFRVRVQLILAGLRPYGWEIYDEEDGKTVRPPPRRGTPARRCWRRKMWCSRWMLTPANRTNCCRWAGHRPTRAGIDIASIAQAVEPTARVLDLIQSPHRRPGLRLDRRTRMRR